MQRRVAVALIAANITIATFGLVARYVIDGGYGARPASWQMYSGR